MQSNKNELCFKKERSRKQTLILGKKKHITTKITNKQTKTVYTTHLT